MICGAAWETAQEFPLALGNPDAGLDVQAYNVSVSAVAASVNLTFDCSPGTPNQRHATWGYTATSTGVTFYLPQTQGGVRADLFKLQ